MSASSPIFTPPSRELPDPPFGKAVPSREAIAAYLLANWGIIRRRVRGKLRAAGIASAFQLDPDDVTSSIVRRVDTAVLRGVLRTDSEREFWAYIGAIADNLVHDRVAASKRRPEAAIREVVHAGESEPLSEPAATQLRPLMESLDSPADRELLLLRMRGAPYEVISQAMGRTPAALRTRWSVICRLARGRPKGAERM